MKKVAIVGPECTGKSWLSENLASHYGSRWVPEYAREYIDRLDRPYVMNDLLEIAKGQVRLEDEISEKEDQILFCDTDLFVIKVWSEHKYGRCHPWILEEIRNRYYDLHLLTYVDLPWKEDPQREHPGMRNYFYDVYFNELKNGNIRFSEIRGLNEARLQSAIDAVNLIL